MRSTLMQIVAIILIVIVCAPYSRAQVVPEIDVAKPSGDLNARVPLIHVPGPDGAGYTLMLSYSSDVSPEQEASFVGFGWSLNVPSIHRARMGFPDDAFGQSVRYERKDEVKSLSVSFNTAAELLALDDAFKLGGGGGLTINSNSLTGISISVGLNLNLAHTYGSFGVGATSDGTFGMGLGAGLGGARIGSSLFAKAPGAGISSQPFLHTPVNGTIISLNPSLRVLNLVGSEAGINATIASYQPVSSVIERVCGYMYIPETVLDNSKSDYALDYLTEGERPIDGKKPSPLPVPVPAPDHFIVSAPGIGGTFRLHHPLPLRVRPTTLTSRTTEDAGSVKVIISGPGAGIGGLMPRPSIMTHTTSDSRNGDYANASSVNNDVMRRYLVGTEWKELLHQAPPVFRYVDDAADAVSYSSSTTPVPLWALSTSGGIWASAYTPANGNAVIRTNRSIEWRTVGDFLLSPLQKPFQFVDFARAHDKAIGEFVITSENGVVYKFDKPVFSLREVSVVFGRKGTDAAVSTVDHPRVWYTSNANIESNAKRFAKRSDNGTYVTGWYCTEILSANYVDVDNNGASTNDHGGWTKFTYSNPSTIPWRSPYSGFYVSHGNVEDKDDDNLSYSTGSAQRRLLKRVETRTHFAVLHYGTRLDDFPPSNESYNVPKPRSGDNESRCLEKIELFVKPFGGGAPVLLRTVFLQYDYSTWPGNPSSASDGLGGQLGKLTLRRVWTEERDVRNSVVHTTEFFYQYPQLSGGAITASKDAIDIGALNTRYPDKLSFSANGSESPVYNANQIDGWGFQQGIRQMLADVGQGEDSDIPHVSPRQSWQPQVCDPAAWRLKSVRYPSGARSVIGYESKSYAWVQDKRATLLCRLDPLSGDYTTGFTPRMNDYVVNLEELGVNGTTASVDVDSYVRELKTQFMDRGEPIFFDFSYSTNDCFDNSKNSRSRGYGKVSLIERLSPTSNKVRLKIGEMPVGTPLSLKQIVLANERSPYSQALKYWYTFKMGSCRAPRLFDPEEVIQWAMSAPTRLVSPHVMQVLSDLPQLVPTHSYVKLPVFTSKTGGGVRVKSIVMVSPEGSTEVADEIAIGSTYHYEEVWSGRNSSSGVVLIEPNQLRDECALVGIDTVHWPHAGMKILGLNEIAQYEGPIGRSYLSPQLLYASIESRSINASATAPPRILHSYITARDVPTLVTHRVEQNIERNEAAENSWGPLSSSSSDLRVVQSTAVELRNYHGLTRSIQHYTAGSEATDPTLIRSVRYEYQQPGERWLMYDTVNRSMRYESRGQTQDIIIEGRSAATSLNRGRLDFSIELTPATPLGFAFGFGFGHVSLDHQTNTYCVSKVTTFNPQLTRTITYEAGQVDTQSVIAYDLESGRPAIMEGTDDYHGLSNTRVTPSVTYHGRIYSLSVPAFRTYPVLGQKSKGYRYTFQASTTAGPKKFAAVPICGETNVSVTASGSAIDVLIAPVGSQYDVVNRVKYLNSIFSVGDKVEVGRATTSDRGTARVTAIQSTAGSVKLTLVSSTSGFVLPTTNANGFYVRLISSGKGNRLSETAAIDIVRGLDIERARSHANQLASREWMAGFINDALRGGTNYMNARNYWAANGTAHLNPFRVITTTSPHNTWTFGACSTWVLGATEISQNNPYRTNESKFAFVGVLRRPLPLTQPRLFDLSYGIINPVDATPACNAPVPPNYEYQWSNLACATSVWHSVTCSTQVPSAVQARSLLSNVDRNVRFFVTDRGRLVPGVLPPGRDQTGTGLHVDANAAFMTSDAANALVTTELRAYDQQLIVYKPLVHNGTNGVVGLTYLPVASWMFGTTSTIAGHQPSILSYDQTGTHVYSNHPSGSGFWGADQTLLPDVLTLPSGSNPNDGWHKSSVIVSHNANGYPEEVVDNMGVQSNVQYAYGSSVPIAVFANATRTGSYFESFESCSTCSELTSYTGRKSLLVESSATVANPRTSTPSYPSTARIRLWIRSGTSRSSDPLIGQVSVAGTTLTADHLIARVGEWKLFDLDVSGTALTSGLVINTGPLNSVYVDDIIVSGIIGTTGTTVLDNEYRTTARHGDDHFAVRSFYDVDGRVAKIAADRVTGDVVQMRAMGHLPEFPRPSSLAAGASQQGFSPLSKSIPSLQSLHHEIGPFQPQGIGVGGEMLNIDADPNGVLIRSPIKPNQVGTKQVNAPGSVNSEDNSSPVSGDKP